MLQKMLVSTCIVLPLKSPLSMNIIHLEVLIDILLRGKMTKIVLIVDSIYKFGIVNSLFCLVKNTR